MSIVKGQESRDKSQGTRVKRQGTRDKGQGTRALRTSELRNIRTSEHQNLKTSLTFFRSGLIPGAFQFYLLKAKCQNFSHFLIGFKTGGILQLFARAPHHMLHPVAKKRLHIFTFKPQGAIQTFSVGIFQIDQ